VGVLYSNNKMIKSIVKIFILACFIVFLLGYPIVTQDTNPFVFYWDKVVTIWNGCIIS